jgi:hypothetical protein
VAGPRYTGQGSELVTHPRGEREREEGKPVFFLALPFPRHPSILSGRRVLRLCVATQELNQINSAKNVNLIRERPGGRSIRRWRRRRGTTGSASSAGPGTTYSTPSTRPSPWRRPSTPPPSASAATASPSASTPRTWRPARRRRRSPTPRAPPACPASAAPRPSPKTAPRAATTARPSPRPSASRPSSSTTRNRYVPPPPQRRSFARPPARPVTHMQPVLINPLSSLLAVGGRAAGAAPAAAAAGPHDGHPGGETPATAPDEEFLRPCLIIPSFVNRCSCVTQATAIGKAVCNFRKHGSKQIRNLVRSLVEYVSAHHSESSCARTCSSLC